MSEAPSALVPETAAAPSDSGKTVNPWWRRACRAVLGSLSLGYLLALVVLLVALEWWGENHWLLSVALYAPPVLVLAPLLILMPACLALHPRLVVWHLLATFGVIFGFMTFRYCATPIPTSRTVTAVTFNMGQASAAQFEGFLDAEKPDLLLLQDAGARGARFATRVPHAAVVNCGEFTLISKHPVRQATLLSAPRWEGEPVGARFEVLVRGEPLILYNVRMPTPRAQRRRFLDRHAVDQLLNDKERRKFSSYREWVNRRTALARALAVVFAAERQPFLVAGDFNTPDHGYIYHLFADTVQDAFAKSGRGWGFTFPGRTRRPADLLAPWLRLDYFFVGNGWRAIECRSDGGRLSEHRAVVARFEPLK